MFEKLVVSTSQRRKHTTAKFFAGTVLLYAIVAAGAFVISVVVSDTRLADTSIVTGLTGPPPMSGSTTPKPPASNRPTRTDVRPDPNNVMTLDKLLSHRDDHPPVIPNFDRLPGGPGLPGIVGPPGLGGGLGVLGGIPSFELGTRPDPPALTPVAAPIVRELKPLVVTSSVLQGKAVERRVPVYPTSARLLRLQGNVAVEVIISPEGKVESARAISGHALLIAPSLEAVRGWHFEPTLLNGVPVRVTGVITFAFKLTA